MPFAIAAAGIGAAGSIASGIMSSNAAKSAAKAQGDAANKATGAELAMFNTAQSDLQPWMTAGTNGLAALQQALGIGPGTSGVASSPILAMLGIGPNGATGGGVDPSTFQNSPGYQYQLQQTMNAIQNQGAAHGGLGGNALKALQSNAAGLANQNWTNYLGSANTAWQGMIGNLSDVSRMGLNAGTSMAGNAMNMGQMQGSNIIGAGNAQASGIVGASNALNKGIGGAEQAIMSSLLGGGGNGGGFSSAASGLYNGIGNLLGGYQWDGMAGRSMLNNLSNQAAGNIAGGAAL